MPVPSKPSVERHETAAELETAAAGQPPLLDPPPESSDPSLAPSAGDETANQDSVDVAPTSDPRALVELLNELLGEADVGAALPANTSAGNVIPRLRAILRAFAPSDDFPTEDGEAPAAAPVVEPGDDSGASNLKLENEQLRRRLDDEERRQAADREEQFARKLDELVRTGRLAPADRRLLADAAGPAGFSLALLEPYARIPPGTAIPLRPIAKAHARARPPEPPKPDAMNDERALALARSFKR